MGSKITTEAGSASPLRAPRPLHAASRRCRPHLAVALVAFSVGGCTHWGSKRVYHDQREVGRRLLGAPHMEESTSSSGSAAFVGARERYAYGSGVAGGLSASHGSVRRNHCVQQAEIDYVQDYEVVSVPRGRALDIAGGVALAAIGAVVLLATNDSQDPFFAPEDPLYTPPPDPTLGYALGGGGLVGGLGLIWYSNARLPSGLKPAPRIGRRQWSETQYVEASGCGPVPGDEFAPERMGTEERLRELDDLREAGTLTAAEYQRKRREVIEGL